MITGEIHEPLPRGAFVAEWSLRRRWALAVCLMVGFLCCGLGAAPVAAFLDHTDRQGDPPATAIEAVDIYLNQLLLEEQIGLGGFSGRPGSNRPTTERWIRENRRSSPRNRRASRPDAGGVSLLSLVSLHSG